DIPTSIRNAFDLPISTDLGDVVRIPRSKIANIVPILVNFTKKATLINALFMKCPDGIALIPDLNFIGQYQAGQTIEIKFSITPAYIGFMKTVIRLVFGHFKIEE
ncbi:hypothetical protein HK096_007019, partial [Nowakowskiella sp. JEL0078]